MPRLMSFAKTLGPGNKMVARRDGWRFLRTGDVLEAVDISVHSPYNGGQQRAMRPLN